MKGKCVSKDEKSRLCLPFSIAAAAVVCILAALRAHGFLLYPGDVNLDRQIDVSDGVMIARFCSGDSSASVTEEGLANADADLNGEISTDDMTCVLRMIVGFVPKPRNPYETTVIPRPVTTAPAEQVLTSMGTTGTTAEQTQPDQDSENHAAELLADGKSYPLGVSISVLTGSVMPAETLTVPYRKGNVIFSVFADMPEQTVIAFAFDDKIFGYYLLCREYTAPAGYTVREFCDKTQNDRRYAILIEQDGMSIRFTELANCDDLEVLSKLAFYASNGIRAQHALPGYRWDPELAKAARLHSADMAVNNFCEHESSDGTVFGDRLDRCGIGWQSCAENIDFGYLDPFSAVNGWYNSLEGHRGNLLSQKYTRTGIAFAYHPDADYLFYGTQDFCRLWGD